MTTPTYVTVNQFVKSQPAFTNGGLRNLIFKEQTNGLRTSGAVVRVGRKILIDLDKFFIWIAEQGVK